MTLGDEIPYHSEPIPAADPRHLAGVANVLGRTPPRVDTARILEIGCATGANLISLAAALPGATCIGIDISERELEIGRARAARVPLTNITLRRESIEEFRDSPESFDFILCHGIYSWVPAPVRAAILSLCARYLAPDGIAYISYNTFPGWLSRQGIRELMFLGAGEERDPDRRAVRARSLVTAVHAGLRSKEGWYDSALKQELGTALNMPNWYLAHDYLAPVNQPFYVREFLADAAGHGLAHLGDSEASSISTADLGPEAQAALKQYPYASPEWEQLKDFFRHRMFRRTLLVRGPLDAAPRPSPDRFGAMYISSSWRCETPLNLQPGVEMKFALRNGGALVTKDPFLKAAAAVLQRESPGAIAAPELCAAALALARESGQLSDRTPDAMLGVLVPSLAQCFFADLVRLSVIRSGAVGRLSDTPRASRLARALCSVERALPNLLHETVELTSEMSALLPVLDGTRSLAQLRAERGAGVDQILEQIRAAGLLES